MQPPDPRPSVLARPGTKLVCTVGPASVGRVAELATAGMDVARINFSHGTPAEQAAAAARVRDVPGVALLIDLPGPKIRLGDLAVESVALEAGAVFTLRPETEDVVAIGCYTRSGRTARIISSLRPPVPIMAFSPDPAIVDRLGLVHGVVARSCVPPRDDQTRLGLMAQLISDTGTLPTGAAVVLVASTAEPGSGPNLLEIHRV